MKLLLLDPSIKSAKNLQMILQKNKDIIDITQVKRIFLNFLSTKEYHGVMLNSTVATKDLIEIVNTIRDTKKSIPVILLVKEETQSFYKAEFGMNIDSYLDLHLDEDDFLSNIRLITRKERKLETEFIVCGNVTLNKSCYKISTPHGSSSISQKEFLLLEILFENQGKYVPTENLKSKVWEASQKHESNLVWTYFSYIRKKFVSIKANLEIKSTRFLGYTLIVMQQ